MIFVPLDPMLENPTPIVPTHDFLCLYSLPSIDVKDLLP